MIKDISHALLTNSEILRRKKKHTVDLKSTEIDSLVLTCNLTLWKVIVFIVTFNNILAISW